MKTIRIYSIGKINLPGIQKLIDDYKKRIRHYFTVEEIMLKESAYSGNPVEKESDDLLKALGQQKFIVCDIAGKQYDSIQFSEMIFDYSMKTDKIVFVIGGSNGISEKLLSKASLRVSFSMMTYNHQLFKVLLYEQIYRSITIHKGLPYHK